MTWPYRSEQEAQLVVESPTVGAATVGSAVAEFAGRATWNHYPAGPERISRRLAALWDVDESSVRLGSGSSAILHDLVGATLLAGGSLAYPGTTFPGYVEHVPDPARERHADALFDYGHDPRSARLSAWLTGRAGPAGPRACIVCLPAAPLPMAMDEELRGLKTLLDADPDVHVAIDAAYCPWSELPRIFDAVRTSTRPERCTVIFTASKTLGLAGLRLGAAVLGPSTLREIGYPGGRFPVSALQLVAWDALLDDAEASAFVGPETAYSLHRQIRGLLGRAGVPVVAEARGLYLSVPLEYSGRLKNMRGKIITEAGLVRLRVDSENARPGTVS